MPWCTATEGADFNLPLIRDYLSLIFIRPTRVHIYGRRNAAAHPHTHTHSYTWTVCKEICDQFVLMFLFRPARLIGRDASVSLSLSFTLFLSSLWAE
jgi:hypothetical protein